MVFDARGKIEKHRRRAAQRRAPHDRGVHAGGQRVRRPTFLAEHAHPALYRVHDVPSAEKVAALRDFLAELGPAAAGRRRSRGPRTTRKLLERIRPRPDFALLQTILLRSLKQAVYSPRTSATSASHSTPTCTSPRRSGATPTSWCIARSRRCSRASATRRTSTGRRWAGTARRPSGAPTRRAATSRAG
jgi:hypothetical protein